MDAGTAAVVGALIGALGGLVVARSEYRQKGDELFFRALAFLDGGSQKRNLGISAIELYWHDPRHHRVTVPLLTGTALYLLGASEQERAPHELFNLCRVMTLLLNNPSDARASRTDYKALLAGLIRKQQVGDTEGLHVDKALVNDWTDQVKKLLPG